ncbi:d485e0c0-0610-4b75-85bf-e13bfecf125a [Thermothielavioides terrestris]|uniref:D485e0c0-0610-4b75-85bf-e13bfecf125a n=1 Tax=Thermothielavioides terrestris TaxID=2587410 RepID=A0A446BHB8_9PEZI|nr:d485e0c0-0610-4b75-85bf-e13bfecf125a [Thermothielavioides terrestris]
MSGRSGNSVTMPDSFVFDWPSNPDFSAPAPAPAPSSLMEVSNTLPVAVNSLCSPLGNSFELHSSQATASPNGTAGGNYGQCDSGEQIEMDFERSPAELCLQPGLPLNNIHQDGHVQQQLRTTQLAPDTNHRSTPSTYGDSDTTVGGTATGQPPPAESSTALFDALRAYCSSVIRRECDVAGLASAVAEYMAWMRKMLGNIEGRVRELVDVARKGHDGPLHDLLGAVGRASGGGAVAAARVAELEAELQRLRQEQTRFFERDYDACKLLSEQTEKRP